LLPITKNLLFVISISDISNGRQIAKFKGQIDKLTKDEHQWISPNVESLDPDKFTSGSFLDSISDESPAPFSVFYSDYHGTKFTARFTIFKDFVTDQVMISFLPPVSSEEPS